MNFSCNDKISNNQLRAIIIAAILGNAAITLPIYIINISGAAAYISIAIGGAFSALLFYILLRFTDKFFVKSYDDMVYECLGNVFGVVIFLIMLAHVLFFCSFQLSMAADMIKSTMEKNINDVISAIVIVVVSAYIASRGMECLGRVSEIASVLMLIFIAFIFIMSISSMDWKILIPTVYEKQNIIKGAFNVFCYLSVAEYIFILASKTNNTNKAALSVFTSFIIITAFVSFGTALAVSCFGVDESKRKIWAVIQMMNYAEFPGSLVERQEVLMSGFYVFSSFILTGMSVYIASVIISSIFKRKNNIKFVFMACLGILLICLVISKINFDWLYAVYVFNIIMCFIVILSPAVYIIRRKK